MTPHPSPHISPQAPRRVSDSAARALSVFDLRECRVCGCTDDDCQCCITRTGSPCHWVEYDLCSACQTHPLTNPKENPMSAIGEKISTALQAFEEDYAKFETGNHSAGVRARKALQEIKKLAGDARKSINTARQKKQREEAA